MGTHAMISVVDINGGVHKLERTMDGYTLIENAWGIVQVLVLLPNCIEGDLLKLAEGVGGGSIEIGEQCEYEAEYLVEVDHREKFISCYGFSPIRTDTLARFNKDVL